MGRSIRKGLTSRRKFGHQKRVEIQKPEKPPKTQVVGVVAKTSYGFTLLSTDRRDRDEYVIRNPSKAREQEGELVVATILKSNNRGRHEVEIKQTLGSPEDPKNISLIALHTHEIPFVFPEAALDEANAAKPVTHANRTDLRGLPLVTIDGADARDFDDAVFAEKDGTGWHLIVAIADVAHYVKASGPLDNEAFERGNSVYFPDRVVPMLPEALSNNLCSLMPKVERACMAVHLYLSREGELERWNFVRGVMKSAARLTYEQVQAAFDGKPDPTTEPLLEKVIKPLYGAYHALQKAREKRGTLELDLPERKVELGKDGKIKAVKIRERLDSHKLVEEFMIAANVAAASQLEGKGNICIYRVHDRPSDLKLVALREFLENLGISLVPAKQLHPRFLTQILQKVEGTPNAPLVNEVMLRSQSQAIYSRENIGHFGLALAKYAHFTSPIRRYADLMVHRALIKVCKLGTDGLTDEESKKLEDIAEHISTTERRAATAERDVVDRFTVLYMSEKIGATFKGRISGVAKFGLFVRITDIGAEGIIPFNALPRDFYNLDEGRQALVGQRTNRIYQLTQEVTVKVEKADRLTGSLSLSIVEDKDKDKNKDKNKPASKPQKFDHGKRTKGRRR
jgi:ribonuclease R